jgi:hypothetical protein
MVETSKEGGESLKVFYYYFVVHICKDIHGVSWGWREMLELCGATVGIGWAGLFVSYSSAVLADFSSSSSHIWRHDKKGAQGGLNFYLTIPKMSP